MSNDIEFVYGLIVKPPHQNAPDFVKASISINIANIRKWLDGRAGEWVNVDVKESRNGKWYASVNDWKPKDGDAPRKTRAPVKDCPQPDQGGFTDDDVPF